ncbi:MAG: SDR family oxidoreductase [Geminicoccaceae bacterium]
MPLSDYRTALVTGASSGIGASAVTALRERGVIVHALARREERLEALSEKTGCLPIILDLRNRDAVYQTLTALDIDILVANAGIGRGIDGLVQAAPEDIDITIETNVQAMLHVLSATLPGMIERRRGHIVNIGSVAGLYPITSAIYGASKGAVRLLSQNLRLELKGSGIRVTEICPGRVATEFFDASISDPERRDKTKNAGFQALVPDDIADAIMFALDAPWRMNVSTIEIQPTEQTFGGMSNDPL